MFPRLIRNFNAFVDGRSYFGKVEEGKLPDVKLKTDSYRGNMDTSIDMDMGMEPMGVELTVAEWDPRLIGTIGSTTSVVLRPVKQGENGQVDAVIATMRARWTGLELGALKPGEKSTIKLVGSVHYYRLQENGIELCEIDVENMVRRIGGIDQLAAHRRAMGL